MIKLCRPFFKAEPGLVGQKFGVNPNPIQLNGHTGIDILPDNVYRAQWLVAPEDCIVLKIVNNLNLQENSNEDIRRGYGILLKGLKSNLEYLYWHCEPVFPVKINDILKQGQICAQMGNSGYVYWGGQYVPIESRLLPYRPGKHLHFEVEENEVHIDPLPLIDWTIPVEGGKQSIGSMIAVLMNMLGILK